MTLYVERPDNPPAGFDWTYMVPGRYLEDITGIVATLTTGAVGPPTVMHDRSGNGNDGTYQYNPAVDPLSPSFPGANEALWFDNNTFPHHYSYGDTPGGVDFTMPFSFDCWVKGDPAATWDAMFGTGNTTTGIGADFAVNKNGLILWRIQNATDFYQDVTAAGVFPFDGNQHHVGLSFDGTIGTIYLDGAAVAATHSHSIFAAGGAFDGPRVGRCFGATPGLLGGQFGQPAFYPTNLGGGSFAAHAAANASLAAYSAAVLADSPTNYYDLDDETGSGGRTPALFVSDGTSIVELIPDGFTAQTTPGPYTYSWLPTLAADTRDPTGTITSVAIPRLILPAGYTIGTRTPDIQPGDQWSDVTIWWDDNVQQALDPLNGYMFPGGIRLRYERQEVPA